MKIGKWKQLLLAGVFVGCMQLSAAYTFQDCERWAKEGECINNPRFIWVHCLSSCVKHATDDNEKCPKWRDEGECSANPRYVPLHCPKSCDYSPAWHPTYRRALDLDLKFVQPLPPNNTPPVAEAFVGHDANGNNCPSLGTNAVYNAAITMHQRISNILNFGYYDGFAQDSPSEFLQSYGLFEGVLYAMRLYDMILSTGRVASRSEKRVQAIIRDMEDSLKSYGGDLITRSMRGYLRQLDEAGQLVTSHLEKEIYYRHQSYARSDGEGCIELLELYLNDIHKLYSPPPTSYDHRLIVSQTKGLPPVFKLSNGVEMSSIGLGTWKLNGDTCENTVYEAIKLGYRSIDTAQAYGNEAEVGRAINRAIKDGIVKRQNLFIATKISSEDDAGYSKVINLVKKQLKELQVDYIDLYYLHSPLKSDEITRTTWSGLEKLYKDGKIRSLGLSNHNSQQVRHHISVTGTKSIAPMVLQNKFDLYHPGKQLDNQGDAILETCEEFDIQLVGYSPFSSFPFSLEPIHDPLVKAVANNRSKGHLSTPSSVLVQWTIQSGVAVIPRSVSKEHLSANFAAAASIGHGTTEEGKLRRGRTSAGSALSPEEMADRKSVV